MPQSTVTFLHPITQILDDLSFTVSFKESVPLTVHKKLVPLTITLHIPDEYGPSMSMKLDVKKEALIAKLYKQDDDTTGAASQKFPPINIHFNPIHPHHWLDLANSINAWFNLPKLSPQSANYDEVLDAFWMCVAAGSPGLHLGDNWENHARGVDVRCRYLRRLIKYTEIGTSLRPYNLHRHWIELQDLLTPHFSISYYG
ncbi:hypothetical protein FRC03_009032 [Tulasnella sp. 419]|nr:hypothetical protein FRC03_009032 [Tulasnella sp. 419]